MKKFILFCFCLLIFLCGCEKSEEPVSVTSENYASKYLEYEAVAECGFSLADEAKTLKIGDKIGGFTLTKLYAKEENKSVRATFSCDKTVSGEINYKNGGVYSELLRFTPTELKDFPVITGGENPAWFVILENGNPFDALNIQKDKPVKKSIEIKISAFHIHKSAENTICYIEIK